MEAMLAQGISTRRGIMCSHREKAYDGACRSRGLPLSEAAQDHCVLLPLYSGMTLAEQQQVVSALRAASDLRLHRPAECVS
jgi:dTDP-4-amino-4,6-dideoxygalactose transaminase